MKAVEYFFESFKNFGRESSRSVNKICALIKILSQFSNSFLHIFSYFLTIAMRVEINCLQFQNNWADKEERKVKLNVQNKWNEWRMENFNRVLLNEVDYAE